MQKTRTNNLSHWKAFSIAGFLSLREGVQHIQKEEQIFFQHCGSQIYTVSCKASTFCDYAPNLSNAEFKIHLCSIPPFWERGKVKNHRRLIDSISKYIENQLYLQIESHLALYPNSLLGVYFVAQLKYIVNPEGFWICIIGSKVMMILLNIFNLTIGGASLVEALQSMGLLNEKFCGIICL